MNTSQRGGLQGHKARGVEMQVKSGFAGRHPRSVDKASWTGQCPFFLAFLFALLFGELLAILDSEKRQGRAWRRRDKASSALALF